jgi:hypothetical protein
MAGDFPLMPSMVEGVSGNSLLGLMHSGPVDKPGLSKLASR